MLVIKRIHVRYDLKVAPEHHDTVKRVHDMHAEKCPVARSIRDAIRVTTELHMESP